MRFEFATVGQIVFGVGAARQLAGSAAAFGVRALVVTGRSAARHQGLLDSLTASGIDYTKFSVDGEPTVEKALAGVALAKDFGAQMVISIGGGSVLDSGKAIAVLATNPGDPFDYLEVIGRNQPLTQAGLPFIALPTTAGTGSEVTRNAVLSSPEHRVKVSLRSPLMLARTAIVDPELTYDLPPALTASTGMDALTQVIEPYVSNAANPLTDALCRDAIPAGAAAIRAAYAGEHAGRDAMARVSLFGGLALANAKLGAVHGFAGPLGGMYDAPHGAICAALLPYVMAMNVRAMREREAEHPALARYEEIAVWLTGDAQSGAEDGAVWVAELCRELAIPPLSTYGVQEEHFPEIIEKSAKSGSMKGNPLVLTTDEMHEILSQALA